MKLFSCKRRLICLDRMRLGQSSRKKKLSGIIPVSRSSLTISTRISMLNRWQALLRTWKAWIAIRQNWLSTPTMRMWALRRLLLRYSPVSNFPVRVIQPSRLWGSLSWSTTLCTFRGRSLRWPWLWFLKWLRKRSLRTSRNTSWS